MFGLLCTLQGQSTLNITLQHSWCCCDAQLLQAISTYTTDSHSPSTPGIVYRIQDETFQFAVPIVTLCANLIPLHRAAAGTARWQCCKNGKLDTQLHIPHSLCSFCLVCINGSISRGLHSKP